MQAVSQAKKGRGSFTSYLKQFSWNTILRFIPFLFICFLLLNIIILSISHFGLDKLFVLQRSIFNDIIFLSLFLVSVKRLIKYVLKGFIIDINIVLKVILFILLYIVQLRSSNLFEFTLAMIKLPCILEDIYYMDLLFYSMVLFFVPFKPYRKIKAKSNEWAIDGDSEDIVDDDRFKRTNLASNLVEYISNTSSSKSIAVSICGEWGLGKTDFLKRVVSYFRLNKSEFIVMEFNPWTVGDSHRIGEEFFEVFSKRVETESKTFSERLKNYSNRLFNSSREFYFKLVNILFQELLTNETLESKQEMINQCIESSGKKIIIYIDDLDRLTGNEIFEVLRLIRNYANFKNTFYLVAFDYDYVINALSTINAISNEEQYLNKIFQFNIQLPSIHKPVLLTMIRELLFGLNLDQVDEKLDRELTKLSLTQESNFRLYKAVSMDGSLKIENYLRNMRDVKRFTNSLRFVYKFVKGEVELQDLILLELLKVRYADIFIRLKRSEFIELIVDGAHSNSAYYKFNKKNLEGYLDQRRPISVLERNYITTLVSKLFDLKDKGPRRLSSPRNYYLYFSYQIFDNISFAEFNSCWDLTESEISAKFIKWSSENSLEFDALVDATDSFSDYWDIYKFSWAFLSLPPGRNRYISHVADIYVRSISEYSKLYDHTNNDYRFIKLVEDERLPASNRIIFINEILSRGESCLDEVGLDYLFGINLVAELFDGALDDNLGIQDANWLFRNTHYLEKGSNELKINHKTSGIYRKYVERSEVRMIEFTKLIVDPVSFSRGGPYTFDTIVLFIFENIEEFEEKIFNIQSSDEVFIVMRNIIRQNKNLLTDLKPDNLIYYLPADIEAKLEKYFREVRNYNNY